ncbi:ketopantoate reductase family protein [Rheinheimera maricola]|uniref:2-dehydropantoate 2-reductase n=1 Tax=Rheinheimera maricola TaxID=2793282 RepID=A0ABS7X8V9_9GAMM|nr:2-dehydropantoate 2-reductase [Rheinheimera maricola]MBZ9611974.1 2-dehydropantoate 2-reductase [Rheinheimera maricola]
MAQIPSSQSALSWTIVGKGAIGLLAACRLTLANYPIGLWLRQPLAVYSQFKGQQFRFTPAVTPLNAVLIPVKSYAVIDAIKGLLPFLTSNAQLVISHNGMGTISQILPLLQPDQGLWFLTTTHGALKQGVNLFHTGNGQSVLAPLNTAAKQQSSVVHRAMDDALGPVITTENIEPFLWQKLAVNAVINPLTAIHNCSNGALAEARFQPLLDALVLEVCQIASAEGVVLEPTQIQQNVRQVIRNTAENYSSMQQDIVHQRRTEINAINGFIVQQARHYGITVPHNENLLQQVLELENRPYGR